MGVADDLRRLKEQAVAAIEQRELEKFVQELRETLRVHSHAEWLVIAVTFRDQERSSGARAWFPARAVAMTDNSEQHLELGVQSSREHDSLDPNSVTRTDYEWARRGGEWTEWAREVLGNLAT
jgi:hypothetical protein